MPGRVKREVLEALSAEVLTEHLDTLERLMPDIDGPARAELEEFWCVCREVRDEKVRRRFYN